MNILLCSTLLLTVIAGALISVKGDDKCKLPKEFTDAVKSHEEYPDESHGKSKNNGKSDKSGKSGKGDKSDKSKKGNKSKRSASGNSCECGGLARVDVIDVSGNTVWSRKRCNACTNGQAPQISSNFCEGKQSTRVCRAQGFVSKISCVRDVVFYSCCEGDASPSVDPVTTTTTQTTITTQTTTPTTTPTTTAKSISTTTTPGEPI